MKVHDFFWSLAGLSCVFSVGFGAGRGFSNESTTILALPLAFMILALVARMAAEQAERRAVAAKVSAEQSGRDHRER